VRAFWKSVKTASFFLPAVFSVPAHSSLFPLELTSAQSEFTVDKVTLNVIIASP
jgi:hypothetical protein